MIRSAMLSFALGFALVACNAPAPTETADAADPAPAPEAATEPVTGEVQPEWDALDRVQDTCGMSAVRGFLGQLASDIPEDRLPPRVRILAPGDPATLDFVPGRLNILTDENGTALALKCG